MASNQTNTSHVAIHGQGVEIGKLKIKMEGQRASHVKNHILENKYADREKTADGDGLTLDGAGRPSRMSGASRMSGVGWKILRATVADVPKVSQKIEMGTILLTDKTPHTTVARKTSNYESITNDIRKSARFSETNSSWRVLRESLKTREKIQMDNENSGRKSNLVLHRMDELAQGQNNRKSNISTMTNKSFQIPRNPSHISYQNVANQNSGVCLANGTRLSLSLSKPIRLPSQEQFTKRKSRMSRMTHKVHTHDTIDAGQSLHNGGPDKPAGIGPVNSHIGVDMMASKSWKEILINRKKYFNILLVIYYIFMLGGGVLQLSLSTPKYKYLQYTSGSIYVLIGVLGLQNHLRTHLGQVKEAKTEPTRASLYSEGNRASKAGYNPYNPPGHNKTDRSHSKDSLRST